jgi:hypothetical protein
MNPETIFLEYFGPEVLQQIEDLTMSDSRCKEKDRAFLVDLVEGGGLWRGFLSAKQKFQVHRIVELYYPTERSSNQDWEPAATHYRKELNTPHGQLRWRQ